MGNDVDGNNEVIIHKYAFHMIISLTRKLALCWSYTLIIHVQATRVDIKHEAQLRAVYYRLLLMLYIIL